MTKNLYRNIYYVKETFLEFLHCNKKRVVFVGLSILFGLLLGLCVGLNNINNFTFINCTDKSLIAIFSGGNFLSFFIRNTLKYLCFVFVILVLNNFNFVYIFNYLLIGYLAFSLAMNSAIVISLLGFKAVIYVICAYFPFLLLNILFLSLIFLTTKCASDSCCNSTKFSCYPIKTIVVLSSCIVLLCFILSLINLIFVNFIVIIV